MKLHKPSSTIEIIQVIIYLEKQLRQKIKVYSVTQKLLDVISL